MRSPLRVLVVGVGAVGGMLARSIASGAEVVGIDPDPDATFAGRLLHPDEVGAPEYAGVDVVLLATRATTSAEALARIPGELPVVAIHNGLAPSLGLGRVAPVLRGVVDFAASRRDGAIVCTRPGAIHLERAAATERLAAAFGPGPVQARLTDDIASHQWSKLLFNASLDPTAAITGRTLGGVMSDRRSFRFFRDLFREACAVLLASGQRPAPVQGMDPIRLLRLLSLPVADRFVGRIAGWRAAAIESTMLADVNRGRPTEVHYLNGRIVGEAARLGVPVPTHERLLSLFDERGVLAGSPASLL